MEIVSDYFGCPVFDDRVMKAKLSSNVKPLISDVSGDVAQINL